jgi:DNA repair exonuclease SbcCD ATPase subunit
LIEKSTKSINTLNVQISDLNSKLPSAGSSSVVKPIKEQIKKLTESHDKAKAALKKAQDNDAEMAKLFKKARDLIGDLQKIPTLGTRGLIDSIRRYKNIDTIFDGINFVSTVGGAVTGF